MKHFDHSLLHIRGVICLRQSGAITAALLWALSVLRPNGKGPSVPEICRKLTYQLYAGKYLSAKEATVMSTQIIRASIALLLSPGLMSCAEMPTLEDESADVAAVLIEVPADQLLVGRTAHLFAIALDDAGSEVVQAEIVWQSSNETVARVDDIGRVTAVTAGNAMISAGAGRVETEAILRVVDIPSLAGSRWTRTEEYSTSPFLRSEWIEFAPDLSSVEIAFWNFRGFQTQRIPRPTLHADTLIVEDLAATPSRRSMYRVSDDAKRLVAFTSQTRNETGWDPASPSLIEALAYCAPEVPRDPLESYPCYRDRTGSGGGNPAHLDIGATGNLPPSLRYDVVCTTFAVGTQSSGVIRGTVINGTSTPGIGQRYEVIARMPGFYVPGTYSVQVRAVTIGCGSGRPVYFDPVTVKLRVTGLPGVHYITAHGKLQ